MNNPNDQASYAPVSDTSQPASTSPAGGVASVAPKKKTPQELKKEKDQRLSTQNHLQFREIRDNLVLMRDGGLRMVIRASAINFDLMSPGEQDAVEYAYQAFLNGLNFPIQIVIRSRKLDLNPYLEKLDGLQAAQENQLLAGLMEDYIYNIRGLLEEVNIMNKEFYVIVPFHITAITKSTLTSKLTGLLKPSEDIVQPKIEYEKNKKELIQRTNTIAQGLAQMSIRVAILSTQELIELFYSSYNLEESQVQSLTDVSQLTTPYVTRDGGRVQQPAAPVAPVGSLPQEETPDDIFAAAAHRRAGQPPQAPETKPVEKPESSEPVVSAPDQTPQPSPAIDNIDQKNQAEPIMVHPPGDSSEVLSIPPNPLMNQVSTTQATPPNPLESQTNDIPPSSGGNT